MGELGIDTVAKAIRGETVQANVDTGAGLVTQKNVKDFE
jgi:simple sugar transport system substrate-binding protein